MSETRCGKPAMHKYFWPGRDPSHVCREHAGQLLGIAQALGLYLPMQPPDEGATCNQFVESNIELPESHENQTS